MVKEIESSLLTLRWEAGKTSTDHSLRGLATEPLALHTGKTVGEGAGLKSQGDPDCEGQVQR